MFSGLSKELPHLSNHLEKKLAPRLLALLVLAADVKEMGGLKDPID